MSQLDEVIHQPLRLKIMAALCMGSTPEVIDFPRLKTITQATDGNLGSHLTTLEKAGYVSVSKDFVDKRPRTSVMATAQGRSAFRRHVAYLRDLVDGLGDTPEA